MPVDLSKAHARRLFLRAQGLAGHQPALHGAKGTAQVIEGLGYVQIDTISVVERAHNHTLWSRQPDYAPEYLNRLFAHERRVMEYWYPAASYIPIANYRFCLPMMQSAARHPSRRRWMEEHAQLVTEVLDRIRDHGPLTSADFDAPKGFERTGWWSWKPAKRALEHLYSMGQLMVIERRGFQRVYDLAERFLPAEIDRSCPSDETLARFLARQALDTLGVAGERNTRWRGRYRELLVQRMLTAST